MEATGRQWNFSSPVSAAGKPPYGLWFSRIARDFDGFCAVHHLVYVCKVSNSQRYISRCPRWLYLTYMAFLTNRSGKLF